MEEQEAPKKTLLDVAIEEYNKEKDARTSRILVAATVNPSVDLAGVRAFHESFLDKHEHDTHMTGMVFFVTNENNEKSMIHCFEAPTKVILKYLRDIAETKEELMQDTRICAFTEEVPREFPFWGFRAVHVPVEEYIAPKDFLKTVFETLRHFLELGRELQNMSVDKARDYVGKGQAPQLLNRIPTVERLQHYTQSNELFTIAEYLNVYDSPVDFTLEHELVWPVEPFLKY